MLRLKRLGKILLGIALFWFLLTLWVEFGGKQQSYTLDSENDIATALIVYNPDPIYNLDEQVCSSLAKSLAQNGIQTTVSTVKRVDVNATSYDLIVFCANTYNWQPDWGIQNFIKNVSSLNNQKTLAITLGSGSTKSASKKLERQLKERGAVILASQNLWLLRPNDESKPDVKNVDRANQIAFELGESLVHELIQE